MDSPSTRCTVRWTVLSLLSSLSWKLLTKVEFLVLFCLLLQESQNHFMEEVTLPFWSWDLFHSAIILGVERTFISSKVMMISSRLDQTGILKYLIVWFNYSTRFSVQIYYIYMIVENSGCGWTTTCTMEELKLVVHLALLPYFPKETSKWGH